MTETSAIPSPRRLAADVLRRVLADDAFAAAALGAELDRHPQLTSRERAAATDLTYGALRAARYLEGRLGRLSPGAHMEPPVKAILWVAGYELAFRGVPAHAVVSEAVDVAKAVDRGAAGFVNALLRKLAADLVASPAPPLTEAFVSGAPRWLRRALDRALGDGGAVALLSAGPLPPPLCLRVRRGERDAWLERLREAQPGATFEPSPVSPLAIRCSGGGDPRRLPGVDEGALVVQEEGSQLIAEALGVQPGDRVLDACAGRGNKTLALSDRLGDTGQVDAADLHGSKLDRLRSEAARLGARVGQTFEIDGSVGLGAIAPASYDRVLIDAPCSGTGTLRRRPEILLRRAEADLTELRTLQRAILQNVARAVKPGGWLLYAVCSVLAEECEQVIDGLPSFEPHAVRRLLPQREGSDGYAFALLQALPAQA